MFAYCNNNPVNMYDPSGNACCYIHLSDDRFAGIFYSTGGGGGGCLYGAAFPIQYAKDAHGSGCLKETVEEVPGGKLYRRALPYEYSVLQVNSDGVTVLNMNIAVFEAMYDWPNVELSLARLFSVEMLAGINKDDGLYAAALASLYSAYGSITLFDIITIEAAGHVGALGGTFSVNADGISVGYANGLGGEISISWDYNWED